ncbi:MAG TPA: hypothetical protein VMB05_00125 [Solirubrobacteraceae bacterium]|nr:hypothetical protein [Solirubrobacteraceae bacterium]
MLLSLTALLVAGISLAAAGAFGPPAPPTPPAPSITAKPADPNNQTSAHFAYADSQSGVSYQCQLDGGPLNSCPATGITYAGPLAQGKHSFKVKAISGSKSSSTSSYGWTVDTVAPTTAISYPGDGSTLAAGDWGARCPDHATLCGTANDANGVKTVLVSIQRSGGNWWGGGAFDRTSETFGPVSLSHGDHNSTRWSYSMRLPTDGAYILHVRAIDEAGNTTPASAQASGRFTIDTTPPPVPTITAKPSTNTTSKSASFSFTDTEVRARYLCRRDGAKFSACTSPQSYSSLSLGTHRFEVEAVDGVGNASAPASYSWTVAKTVVEESGKPFTVTGNATGPLAPGVSRALAITVANPNNVAITVTSLSTTVLAGSTKAGCDGPSNLQLTQSNISSTNPLAVPANGHVSLPAGSVSAPSVLMRDLPTNQDACKGASFKFTYSGSAHS